MEASREEVGTLIRHVKAQLNSTLKSICSANGLKCTGVKADLQARITGLLEGFYHARNWKPYRDLEAQINSIAPLKLPSHLPLPATTAFTTSPQPYSAYSQASARTSSVSMPQFYQPHHGGPSGNTPQLMQASSAIQTDGRKTAALSFKPSPFYEPITQIGLVRTLEVMREHKSTSSLVIPASFLQQCAADTTRKIMIFGAKSTSGAQDVAFPHQSDIRIDGAEIKGLNLRGLKNKPGTTRPADVTNAIIARGTTYDKSVEFVYALTNERFYIAAYLCKTSSVEQLITRIGSGNKISKESVLQDFARKEQDDDVVTTSAVLSLKCPISCVRLSLPCRGIACKHVQCFDATSYIQLQQQGPQWLCPVCNKPAPFDQLAVDEYVRDILHSTSSSTDQVTIEPNGKWGLSLPNSATKNNRKRKASTSSDVEELIISGSSTIGRQNSYVAHNLHNRYATPRPATPREPSSTATGGSASVPRSLSGKRPPTQVIDLTLSSDEDDEPIARPTKRQNQGYR